MDCVTLEGSDSEPGLSRTGVLYVKAVAPAAVACRAVTAVGWRLAAVTVWNMLARF